MSGMHSLCHPIVSTMARGLSDHFDIPIVLSKRTICPVKCFIARLKYLLLLSLIFLMTLSGLWDWRFQLSGAIFSL